MMDVVSELRLSHLNLRIRQCDRRFFFRDGSVGDQGVIKQIFKNEDYRVDIWRQGAPLLQYLQRRLAGGERPLIIDAGANIGASAVYFSCVYESARVYALEPEEKNCRILRLNCANLDIDVFQGALGCEDGQAWLSVAGLNDWAFRVGTQGDMPVAVKSPDSILRELDGQDLFPFIFKIDIEGGEGSLFSKDVGWMDRFPLLVIELHDWLLPFQGSSRSFMKALATFDFDVVLRGENLFCFNRRLLASSPVA